MTREDKEELLKLLEERERRKEAQKYDCSELTREESNEIYDKILEEDDRAAQRHLCKTDLFFLLSRAFNRKDVDNDWLYERCREVQADPDGFLDLWARDHYKSTIITFAKTIQDILKNPNITVGIFSHTRPIAKSFLEQIKRELENNEYLKDLFPEVLYKNPSRESPKWSLDGGIVVKRDTNPKESTVEAWGLVDGQPTSRHFKLRVYDDVVTLESVTTPDQIKKVTNAWEISQNLGSKGGILRGIGTRYRANDTYAVILKRKSLKKRVHAATDNGKIDGEPVFLSKAELETKRRDQGPYNFACQMLQNPMSDKAMGFKKEWLKYYENLGNLKGWNLYLLVDPASEKKKSNDYTVMMVIGLAPDQNYYLIDGVRDRLNLNERTEKVFYFHKKYPQLKDAGYEKYGLQSDIEHIQYVQEQENYRFNIKELGGQTPKNDRIRKLVPIFHDKRFYLPKQLSFVDYESRTRDLVQLFIDDEYTAFPVCVHDDMLDCMARIVDPDLAAKFPKEKKPSPPPRRYSGPQSWM